jgi:hypothetical protein
MNQQPSPGQGQRRQHQVGGQRITRPNHPVKNGRQTDTQCHTGKKQLEEHRPVAGLSHGLHDLGALARLNRSDFTQVSGRGDQHPFQRPAMKRQRRRQHNSHRHQGVAGIQHRRHIDGLAVPPQMQGSQHAADRQRFGTRGDRESNRRGRIVIQPRARHVPGQRDRPGVARLVQLLEHHRRGSALLRHGRMEEQYQPTCHHQAHQHPGNLPRRRRPRCDGPCAQSPDKGCGGHDPGRSIRSRRWASKIAAARELTASFW